VQAVPVLQRAVLYDNVVLSGGNCAMPGLAGRLQRELDCMVPSAYPVHVPLLPGMDRQHLAFGGAAVLSSLSSFEEMWICKAEFEETG
jgi:actin-related protein